ncbi:putative Mn2+ efflux pump MntP [Elusimicrobium posterum]|uniref:manganese efflux pump MntP n=1 Tax=Elusimicrobium posterum TaxID=3116653 RepID=UPI003C71149B
MEIWAIIIMFMCLCVDNMVMANMSAMKPENTNSRNSLSLKIALIFSVFHALFLFIGYVLAYLVTAMRGAYSWKAQLWISFSFVMLIGIRLLVETVEKSPSFSVNDSDLNPKMAKTAMLIGLNSVLLGYAIYIVKTNYHFFWAILALFAISMIFSMAGFFMGRPDSKKISSKVLESVAGIIMIILALRIVIFHY